MMGVEAQVQRPTKPRWYSVGDESWTHDPDLIGRYGIIPTGRLWWKRFVVSYDWNIMTMHNIQEERRKLAEFGTQEEAKNYVETVWRMQAGGAFDPRGEDSK